MASETCRGLYSSLSWLGFPGKSPEDGVFGVFIGKYVAMQACGEEKKAEKRLLRIPEATVEISDDPTRARTGKTS